MQDAVSVEVDDKLMSSKVSAVVLVDDNATYEMLLLVDACDLIALFSDDVLLIFVLNMSRVAAAATSIAVLLAFNEINELLTTAAPEQYM